MAAHQQNADLRLGQRLLNLGMELVADIDSFLVEPDPVPYSSYRFQRRYEFVAVAPVLVAETDEDFAVHWPVLVEQSDVFRRLRQFP